MSDTEKKDNIALQEGDKPGVAKIKPEYLLKDYKPTVDTQYVSEAVKEQIEDSQRDAAAASGAKEMGEDEEPPSKRVKLKGRNKRRPRNAKVNAGDRVCNAFIREQKCNFGDGCRFSHDVKKFMESKPDDIDTECYLFETYSKCPYGLTCRFSKSHVTEDLQNKVKDDFAEKPKRESTVSNFLSKDMQHKLWKRKFDFSKADNVVETVCKGSKTINTQKIRDDKFASQMQRRNKISAASDEMQDGENKEVESAAGNVEDINSTNETGAVVDKDQSTVAMESDSSAKVLDSTDAVGASNSTLENTDIPVVESNNGIGEGAEMLNQMEKISHGEEGEIRLRPAEQKKIDFSNKLYLAPLTTVGNLPFRRICKEYGADITCGEMAVCTKLLQGSMSEWALLRRHESEDIFGVQLCGAYPDSMTRCAQLITESTDVDFIDINCGCPIDLIFNKGEGSALMGRISRFEQIVKGMKGVMDVPLTVKVRTGIYSDKNIAHTLMPKLRDWGVELTTLHGRSRVQRYTKSADWDYINECAKAAAPMPLFGNGDILSFEEANLRREETGVNGIMLARGALIKPWIFTEIKEQRHWDISSSERFEALKRYRNYGLDQWGSDQQGVETTRRFLLEWLSFLYRYIPVGVLERVPQRINERPPYYQGRDDLETLMASPNCGDWLKISEMLLGPVPEGFTFLPKHKANAYK